jgi:RNA polymerase sigma factor (sigma-70 family)
LPPGTARTVANLSPGHFRRLAIARRVPADPEPAPHHGADVDYERREQHQALAAAVRRLPQRQRACVVLRYHAGLGEAEIAAELEISVGSVKTHLHRARGALAEHLGSR